MLLFWFWSLVIPIVHMLDHLRCFMVFIFSLFFQHIFISILFCLLFHFFPLCPLLCIPSCPLLLWWFSFYWISLLGYVSSALSPPCHTISSIIFFSYFVVYSHKGTYFLNWGVLFCFSFFKPKILVIICIFSMANFSSECSFSVSNNVCCPFFLLFFFFLLLFAHQYRGRSFLHLIIPHLGFYGIRFFLAEEDSNFPCF